MILVYVISDVPIPAELSFVFFKTIVDVLAYLGIAHYENSPSALSTPIFNF